MRIDSVRADTVVNAFYATIARLTELCPGMHMHDGVAGTRLVYTGLPIPTLNVVAVGRDPDMAEVDAFAEELAAAGIPWSIQVRGPADPVLLALAGRYGRTSMSTLPLQVWDLQLLHTLPTFAHVGTTVRAIDARDREVFAAALADGFAMPREIADVFAWPDLLDAADATAFVLETAGEAVATGFNVISGDHVGLYNGSVLPAHRGRGYYRALVAARLRHAAAWNARYAFVQNTPMSRPLYDSFGFQLVEEWTYLSAG